MITCIKTPSNPFSQNTPQIHILYAIQRTLKFITIISNAVMRKEQNKKRMNENIQRESSLYMKKSLL